MKLAVNIFVFLLLNFTALAIGGFFTGDGVASDWYYNLNKAPWTPPGWAFGVAWTAIMVGYSFYMAILCKANASRNKVIALYAAQLLFNVVMEPSILLFSNPLNSTIRDSFSNNHCSLFLIPAIKKPCGGLAC